MSSILLTHWLAEEPDDEYKRCTDFKSLGKVIIIGAGNDQTENYIKRLWENHENFSHAAFCEDSPTVYVYSPPLQVDDFHEFYDNLKNSRDEIYGTIWDELDFNIKSLSYPEEFKIEYTKCERLFPSEDREDMLKRRKLYNKQQTAKFNAIGKQYKKANRPQKKLQSNKKRS